MVQSVRPSFFLKTSFLLNKVLSAWSTIADISCWLRCQILLGRPGSQRSTNKPRVYLVKALKIWPSSGTRYHISSRKFVLLSFFITWIRNFFVSHRTLPHHVRCTSLLHLLHFVPTLVSLFLEWDSRCTGR